MFQLLINKKHGNKYKLGISYHLFNSESYQLDYKEFKSQIGLENYLYSSKSSYLTANFESLVNGIASQIHNRIQGTDEMLNKLRKAIKWIVANPQEYDKILTLIKRSEPTIKNCINSIDGDNNTDYFLKKIIMFNFIDDELSNLKKV